MRTSTLLMALAAVPVGPASAQPADAPPAGSYRSIELRGGGMVTVRYGPTRRVNVVSANPDRPIRTEGDALVIDECRRPCRSGHRIEVEVVTPAVARLAVAHGGRIEVVGGFASQPALAASVSNGGMIDARTIEANLVTAAIDSGGRIYAHAGRELTASIADGGNVTYWGDPRVTSSVRRGGVVEQGNAADLGRPLADLDTALRPPPAVPPQPPRPRGH